MSKASSDILEGYVPGRRFHRWKQAAIYRRVNALSLSSRPMKGCLLSSPVQELVTLRKSVANTPFGFDTCQSSLSTVTSLSAINMVGHVFRVYPVECGFTLLWIEVYAKGARSRSLFQANHRASTRTSADEDHIKRLYVINLHIPYHLCICNTSNPKVQVTLICHVSTI